MKRIFTLLIGFGCFSTIAQVGINTTTPSPASVLHIESTSGGTHFGGLLPPKVTLVQRDLIPVGSGDDGMLIFVSDGDYRCLQIYNEAQESWMNIFCYDATMPVSTILASWEVSGITQFGPSPLEADYYNPQVIGSGLIRGSGLNNEGTQVAQNAWGANGWDGTSNATEAQLAQKYVTFTIGPSVGQTLSFHAIAPYNVRRSNTGPSHGLWQYSLNGIDFVNIDSEIVWGTVYTASGNPQVEIDLSGIEVLQEISYPNQVTFRIVCWNASNSQGTWYINNQPGVSDLIIYGAF